MNKAKILIFENEASFAGILQKTLTEFGYATPSVVFAGEHLRETVQRVKPDLLLVSISLEGWLDSIQAVEESTTHFQIPIIYLSHHTDADIFSRLLITEPSAFLLKPLDSIQLSYTIQIALARHQLEMHRRESDRHHRNVFELSGSALMVMDECGNIMMVNEEFEHLSGFTRGMVENLKNWKDFFHRDMFSACDELLALASKDPYMISQNLPVLLIRNGSAEKSVYLNVKKVNSGEQYIASMVDITEMKRAAEETDRLNSELTRMNAELQSELFERENYEKVLIHQANHDSLTGLPNRQLLFDRLDQAIAYIDRNRDMLALMILDLDNFKVVNDTLGHIAGDSLLKEVARRLQSCLRKYDTVARFGGDEFVIIANAMPDVHDIVGFAQKVLDSFQSPFDIMGKPVHATASIGVGIYPLQSTSTDGLLKMADTAMYQAKNSGGNDYRFFTESMIIKSDNHALMKKRLKAAFAREEFLAHYQPRIDVATRRIIGMEALIRWQPLDGPLVYPADFFPALEESGMVVPVGEWLLEKICRQNRVWHDAGLSHLSVAVNISELQFKQNDFSERVSKALSNSRLDPRFLRIEIPEQIIMKNSAESIGRLGELKSTGVSISVDNFGTGYSSLTQLSRLPIDDIQIDRSLINCITMDQNDANVVSAIISMGHNLGKKLVAEGVESEEQFMFLAQRKCKEMQGHFFSRPLSPPDFEKLTRGYNL